ncbi:MAG: hypothetical protein GY792_25980 [Gammaproteobacteria bacterium]|nr:hypothetical protein [Gammaproteobacteria bacterium]
MDRIACFYQMGNTVATNCDTSPLNNHNQERSIKAISGFPKDAPFRVPARLEYCKYRNGEKQHPEHIETEKP